MSATSKLKWTGTILVAGVVVAMALMGGKWGTSYTAKASVNADPIIYDLIPDAKPVGSDDSTAIIVGANFGDLSNTGVWFKGTFNDEVLEVIYVDPNAISFVIPASLMDVEDIFSVRVIVSNCSSIPTVPPYPGCDKYSNPAPFKVYIPKPLYLPFVTK